MPHTSAAPACVLYVDGVRSTASPVPSSAQLTREHVHGVYTSARSFGGGRVFQLSMHLQRIVDGVCAQTDTETRSRNRTLEQLSTADGCRAALVPVLRSAMRDFGDDDHVAVTLLVDVRAAPHVFVHAGVLKQHEPPFRAHFVHSERENPDIKSTQWAEARSKLVLRDGFNEALLVAGDGRVTEGLSSNLFVVQGGLLRTAGTGVLAGTVRDVVLRVCARHGIPVSLECPVIGDVPLWQEAFITSTSRLVMPLHEIEHEGRVYTLGRTMGLQLAELVQADLAALCETLE